MVTYTEFCASVEARSNLLEWLGGETPCEELQQALVLLHKVQQRWLFQEAVPFVVDNDLPF